MTAPAAVAIHRLDADQCLQRLDALVEILVDCVHGGASVGFMAPLARARAATFWRGVADDVARDARVLLGAERSDGTLVGTVQLIVAQPDNQPHRADLAKLLVHRSARRQGIAVQLLHAAEAEAQRAGKSVLVLDTVTGSDAERLYARNGWQRVGEIPSYALMPDGQRCSTTYFHRQLPEPVVLPAAIARGP